jgi:hypothetical protein
MIEFVLVFMGIGFDTNLNPAFFFSRARQDASNWSFDTFSGLP